MKVWVTTIKSDSGDEYAPLVTTKRPTQARLKRLAKSLDDEDYSDGPGAFGTYIYFGNPRQVDVE